MRWEPLSFYGLQTSSVIDGFEGRVSRQLIWHVVKDCRIVAEGVGSSLRNCIEQCEEALMEALWKS